MWNGFSYYEDNSDEDFVDPNFIEELTDSLLSYAKELDIQVKWAELNPYTPPASDPKVATIVLNSSWHLPNQIPYQLAHEIEHIKHHDEDYQFLYFTTDLKKTIERDANVDAIRLLVNLFMGQMNFPEQVNYQSFMTALEIPYSLRYYVKQAMMDYPDN
ncbi:ImmA/IrrE family metallo-endopeptidase [Lacticaseibacillus saniviri]